MSLSVSLQDKCDHISSVPCHAKLKLCHSRKTEHNCINLICGVNFQIVLRQNCAKKEIAWKENCLYLIIAEKMQVKVLMLTLNCFPCAAYCDKSVDYFSHHSFYHNQHSFITFMLMHIFFCKLTACVSKYINEMQESLSRVS
jgi:hypothetical protein